MFQILGPRNEILSEPWYTVLIGGIVNREFFLRSQCYSFICSKSSVTIKGHRLFFILYISVARIWRFRMWTETEPSFTNRVSNDDCLLEYIIRKQRSCSLFILPLLARLWHIHTRGQQRNCDWKNAFIRIRLFEIFIYEATLASAWTFLLAFWHISEMWSSKESLWLNSTPNSFYLLLLAMSKFPIFILTVSFVLTNKWHMPALIFIKLSLNHLNKIYETSSKDLITPSISSAINMVCCHRHN